MEGYLKIDYNIDIGNHNNYCQFLQCLLVLSEYAEDMENIDN